MTDLDALLIDTYAAHVDDRLAGRRATALADLAGGTTRAYQRLNVLISDPQAWERDPATMGLLRRRRDARLRGRLQRGWHDEPEPRGRLLQGPSLCRPVRV